MSANKENYGISEVLKIVNKAVQGMDTDKVQHVHEELLDLARLIRRVCHDGDALQVNSGKENISKATEELDQVIVATEQATDKIMDACDRIQEAASKTDEASCQAITNETTNIFEACSFQDLTGQRISNAVSALYEIEKRIDGLLETLQGVAGAIEVSEGSEDTRSEEEKLMNGPQMADKAMTQEDIDRLLNE